MYTEEKILESEIKTEESQEQIQSEDPATDDNSDDGLTLKQKLYSKVGFAGMKLKTVTVKPKEYYKDYVVVKNPLVAKNIDMMHQLYLQMRANHKPHNKIEANPNSVQSLKAKFRIQNPSKKITSHAIRVMHNIEKKVFKRITKVSQA